MIKLNDVTVRFGDTIALQPTSLAFHRGQFTVLLGASGAGKSTLLRCLNLMQMPGAGSIEVEGLGPLRSGAALRAHRRNTGMVFQQHQLIARRTALQNVITGRVGHYTSLRSLFPLPHRDQEIALHCLERVGLLHKALARIDQLSGGQQQRVGIARALAQQPRLMLADEPVASLDPATADKVLALLQRVCKEDGISAVVSLHQVELAKRYADRVIGLAHGRVVFDVAPDALTAERTSALYENRPHQAAPETHAPHSFPLNLAIAKD
ncbi:phosphonate ABC transporter ATP-binding protein [Noviherbaspirillum sp. CPCC 100848]|uniref:Phosphonate ABC transporter ATP-binding protein n=1 Tax=Noviherbaspirillum album TaxID=3080276 RepID=A0ABU6J358_9BURK|nr:phosphonate ABC transporter ATP-binding protein [Noviherbaspirillum sp. CPCC 100848]MEC4717960.1 phosphonate ABC transporter ATP-binding protein [Noviherbaspirillum sp. CPCC 100848]